MPKVYNQRVKPYPSTCKSVDRSTPYGNPFIISKHLDRDAVCDLFDAWVFKPEQAALRAKAKVELKGHDLLCWCAPLRCHASTWLCIANAESSWDEKESTTIQHGE